MISAIQLPLKVLKKFAHFLFYLYFTFFDNLYQNRLLSNSWQSKTYFLYLNQFCNNFLSFVIFLTNRIFSLENVPAFDTLMQACQTQNIVRDAHRVLKAKIGVCEPKVKNFPYFFCSIHLFGLISLYDM